MAASYFTDEEDPAKKAAGGAPGAAGAPAAPAQPPTFAQLQQRGMPRPPAMGMGMGGLPGPTAGGSIQTPFFSGGAGGGAPSPYGAPSPQLPSGFSRAFPQMQQPGSQLGHQQPQQGNLNLPPTNVLSGGYGGQQPPTPGLRPPGANGDPTGAGGAGAGPYNPTGELNQGNLEGYLYDMLANPTATPTYQNSMKQIGSHIDTDASKRGVYYSTIPTGSYSQAGSNLAAGLQGQAYNQLRGYNQDYEQLLMSLLGAT